MIFLKDGVTPMGLKPEALLAIIISHEVYSSFGYDLTVTSITDGVHSRQSIHEFGYAIDIRTRNIVKPDHEKIVAKLKTALGPLYDVVLEKDHIHIEFDPRHKGG